MTRPTGTDLTSVKWFQYTDSEGVVVDHPEFPSVWIEARGEIDMDGREVRTGDRAGFVAWLRRVADEIEAAS